MIAQTQTRTHQVELKPGMILGGSPTDFLPGTFKQNHLTFNRKYRFEGGFCILSCATYCSYVIELVEVDVPTADRHRWPATFQIVHVSASTKKPGSLDRPTPYSLSVDSQFIVNPTPDLDPRQLLAEIVQAYRSGSNLDELISQAALVLH